MSETELQAIIMDELRKLGFWVIRLGVNKRRGRRGTNSGERGMPDLYLPGLGHAEVKLPGEELSPDQVAWHAKAKRYNVRVTVWTSAAQAIRESVAWRLEHR